MAQDFLKDDLDTKVNNVNTELIKLLQNDCDVFFETATTSNFLGTIIADTNLLETSEFLDKEFIKKEFIKLIQAFRFLGTYEAYITICKAVFGETVELEFDESQLGILHYHLK